VVVQVVGISAVVFVLVALTLWRTQQILDVLTPITGLSA
jgi:hypothetical protein